MCNLNPNPAAGCTGIREGTTYNSIGVMWSSKVERASIQVGEGEA